MANPNSGSILVVDDEPVIDEDVDVVLHDCRMPDRSGGQTLERIREQGYDCRVAMVTAVDLDFDIVEMDFE